MSDLSVLVVGAGLGGLCLAQGLRRAGIPCAVYERDASPASRLQGYRLHIDVHGDNALRAALPPELHALFRDTSFVARPESPVYDTQLTQVTSFAMPGPVHLNINRYTLRQILLHGIEDDVHFGKQFVRYETGRDGVTAYFADGTTATGTILVGADGVGSPIRAQYLPRMRVVDTGLRTFYGKIPLTPASRELFDDEMFAVFSIITDLNGTMLGVAPVEYPRPVAEAVAQWAPGLRIRDHDHYMTCSFSVRKETLTQSDDELRELSGRELGEIMLDRLRGWHPRVRAMVESCDLDSLFTLLLRTSVPIEPWRSTEVTLLGDAAHAMSPAAGMGANTALRDAGVLAEALTTHSPLDAIERYEKDMTDYGFAAVRQSAANGLRFVGQDPLPL
ncbi:FAD-dependent oxidoreductase [Amycolatopsis sp. H20-H5]|uniref:FAD-dependent oxidoreductase n=1 Tax=Amycolatopsis sp. H20-H5 TaxID=3046309 RepID=UPI002DB563BC|nr:NAD(P)/FAD-dependent oxidoreductase [Amycolatopsis sp. H20-H5]MEC3978939.1 NAD(P)/FAD-dependent oxidoreductase [Amycolatopsis sp. H20-H5]